MVKYCKYCKYYIPDDAIKCAHCGNDQRIIKPFSIFNNLFNILGIIATVAMAGFILSQSINISKQTDSIKSQTNILKDTFLVQNRPYLYVDISPAVAGYDKNNNFYAGVQITYRNEGLFAASEIETDTKIADDGDDKELYDIMQWYIDKYGSFPFVKNVFVKQSVQPFPFQANISDFPNTNEKYIYFGIRIKYKGFTEDHYCYGADYVYKLIKNIDNVQNPFSVTILKYDTYWDKGKNLSMPEIKAPDWSQYKKN